MLEKIPTSRQDIQYGMSIMMQGSKLYISYGVEDCYSALAIVPNLEETLQILRKKSPERPMMHNAIRFEFPVYDNSSILSTIGQNLIPRFVLHLSF